MNSLFLQQKIPIKDLVLWDENARFPDKYFKKTESELIDYFINQDSFKIKTLSNAIVKDFDLPQLERIVVLKLDNTFIVIEGNRRLTSYKLLINPELTSNTNINNFFNELKVKIKINDTFKLECLITTDKEQALRYVDRKHYYGNYEVPWGEIERTHHRARRGLLTGNKEKLRIEIAKIVRLLDLPEEMKEKVLGKGYISTFLRIIDSSPAYELFGFDFDENDNLTYKDEEFLNKLKVIITNILQKKDFDKEDIDSRTLNKKKNIESYINKIKKDDIKKVDEVIKKNTKNNLFGESTLNLSPKNREDEIKTKRNILKYKPLPTGLFYSKDIPFRLGDTHLHLLYNELKDIEVSLFPNATLDLLRSFLECSLIVYFKKNREYTSIKKNDKHNPTLGEMLTHIINGKSKNITDDNLIQVIKQIKTDYDKPYSLERLNMINHNENWVSNEKDARTTWAKLEGLFKILLNA